MNPPFELFAFPGLLYLIALLVVVPVQIWAVLEISKHSFRKRNQKLLWTNVVLLFPLGGWLLYIYYGRKQLADQPTDNMG